MKNTTSLQYLRGEKEVILDNPLRNRGVNINEVIKMKNEKQEEKLNVFGIDEETIQKSINIRPILDLGQLQTGDIVKVEFLEDEPKIIETPNSKFQKTARVIAVKEISIVGAELEYSLFLSSKSLALGINRLYVRNGNKLASVKAIIKKDKAVYKDFGENTCYNVQQLQ